MKICCWRCGHTRIIFTSSGDRFGHHHGAICARCRNPITLKDCLFNTRLSPVTEVAVCPQPSPEPDKIKMYQAATGSQLKR